MFERFTQDARQVVAQAQDEARDLGHALIGTEHLLLAMLAMPGSAAAQTLQRNEISHPQIRAAVLAFHGSTGDDLDGEALRAIGIDLDAVRTSVEASFGSGALDGPGCRAPSGHIPFSPRAKKVLSISLREAIRLQQKQITDGHVLLGLLREGQGLAALVLVRAGVDLSALRSEVETGLRRAG